MSASSRAAAAAILSLAWAAASAAAQGSPLPRTIEFGTVTSLIGKYCSNCHDWASAYKDIVVPARVVPGSPKDSLLWDMIESGQMPLSGPAPSADEKALIRDWIAAGAPDAMPVSGASPEAPGGAPGPKSTYLGFPSKADFHRFSGWTSGGLLLAAGIVGAVHAYDLISAAHAYRDTLPESVTNDGNSPACQAEIQSLWGAPTEQALRWTHVSLLVAGEGFYLANAFTGVSFIGPDQPGLTKSKLHRWAFFLHAGLMASELVMGYFTSDALRRGDHETVHSLGVAHAAVGIAIPVVILSAGSIMGRK